MSISTHPNIIRDAFTYFAKFPDHDRVMDVFVRPAAGSAFSGYATLKSEINALTEHSLVPEIEGFVFGPDENVIRKQIEDIGGKIFMFLDYGPINSGEDQTLKYKTDEFELALTIARPYKPDEQDIPELVLLGDETLNALRRVREQMIADQKCSPFMKQILFPHQVLPWYARDLANSQGWTMVLRRRAIAML